MPHDEKPEAGPAHEPVEQVRQQVIRDAACQLGRMGAPPGDGSDALLEDILIALEASQTLLERATAYDRRPFQGVLTTWSPPASYGRSEEDEE